jgi:hypothetical protein
MDRPKMAWIKATSAVLCAFMLCSLRPSNAAEHLLETLGRLEEKPASIDDALAPLKAATKVSVQVIPKAVTFEFPPSRSMIEESACFYSTASRVAIEALITELRASSKRATAGTRPTVMSEIMLQFVRGDTVLGDLDLGPISHMVVKPMVNRGEVPIGFGVVKPMVNRGEVPIGFGVVKPMVNPREVPVGLLRGAIYAESGLPARIFSWIRRADVSRDSTPAWLGSPDRCLESAGA